MAVEAILGVRVRGDKLHLEPCIPTRWPGYEVACPEVVDLYDAVLEIEAGGAWHWKGNGVEPQRETGRLDAVQAVRECLTGGG